ncbi:hypothetical protein GCM10017714_22070 [Curtobacterium pusillum]|uniref:Oligosaccharide repeat unit polymerase n=1 Tax=Curtobacterium pusillum TaxID=69373 RepID=A0ABX2M8D0_9MICO|nr:O-antigen polymerase [Curtobacterium pusillum]NUU14324.1 oligosaccharide repeat unit polymerase [Curtobacterium pusillum]GLK32069.1 hypothetical protein GCM10017610_23540 [Curtobacterium pusillum]
MSAVITPGSARSIDGLALLRPVRTVAVVLGLVSTLALTTNWISQHLVAPLFSYSGFTYVPADPQSILLAVLMTTGVALSLPGRITRPSHVVLWTLFVVCVSPTMLMSVSTGYLDARTALLLTAAVGSSFALVCLGVPRSAVRTPKSADASDTLTLGRFTVTRSPLTWTVCTVYSLLTYGIMAATVGVHVRFLALDDIYDVRADYTADVGTGGTLGYLLTGQAYVVNPLILARGLFRRRPSLIVLAIVGQFLLYSSTGFKAVLFSFIAVLGMAVLFRGRAVRSSLPFLIAPLTIMVVSAAADELQGGITWTSVFTRRFMLTPGLLTSVYTDYFSQNPVAMYGYSFLDTWVDYPYDLPPPKRIADYLMPGSTGYANANLFADGFANFGWIGIFVAAGALFVWLRCVDIATRGLPMRVAAMALVMPSIMLSNTSIFTAMLSHGLLLGTLVLLIAPRTGWERRGVVKSRTDAETPHVRRLTDLRRHGKRARSV